MENVTKNSIVIDGVEYPITRCPVAVAEGAYGEAYEITARAKHRHGTKTNVTQNNPDGHGEYFGQNPFLWWQEAYVYRKECYSLLIMLLEMLPYVKPLPRHGGQYDIAPHPEDFELHELD